MSTDQRVISLRALLSKLRKGRQDYDFMPPTPVSHVSVHAHDLQRLRKYAAEVIPARTLILLASTQFSTQHLVQTFLLGVDNNNPFPMLLAARSQMELFASVADACHVIRENAGQHEDRFQERVQAVDNALINVLSGTRSAPLKEALKASHVSKARPVDDKDLEVLSAKNILTRLGHLEKRGEFANCREVYERLCEFVHPNWGMNYLYLEVSPRDRDRFNRLSAASGSAFKRAFNVSIEPMVVAAKKTASAFDDLPTPFGMGGRVVP
jgi:hypothetical protein